MKKIILSIITLLSVSVVHAQLLYRISGNGAKDASYIFGTHHIAPVSILDSIPGFNEALASVDAVYGEIVHEQLTSAATQQLIMQRAIAPADSTLSKVFSIEQLDSIDAVLKKYSGGILTIQQLNQITPAFVAMQLAVMQSMAYFPDFNPNQQLDVIVQERGKLLDKERGGFETAEFQVNLLYGDPISVQAEELMKTIRLDSISEKCVKELSHAYISQDLNTCHNLLITPEYGFEQETADKLINNRNADWAKLLIPLIKEKSVLVCVGAGHLLGEKGLINLLKMAGYTIEPVN